MASFSFLSFLCFLCFSLRFACFLSFSFALTFLAFLSLRPWRSSSLLGELSLVLTSALLRFCFGIGSAGSEMCCTNEHNSHILAQQWRNLLQLLLINARTAIQSPTTGLRQREFPLTLSAMQQKQNKRIDLRTHRPLSDATSIFNEVKPWRQSTCTEHKVKPRVACSG